MRDLTNDVASGPVRDLRTQPMQNVTTGTTKSYSSGFIGIFFVSFVVFLTIAVCAQMVALPWRSWLPGAEGQKSLIGGVRTSVYTFMSYLN
jgi:light-harvesting complex 1 beta chain